MANRKRQPRSTDRRYFKRTASQAKKININPTIMRGGIRF